MNHFSEHERVYHKTPWKSDEKAAFFIHAFLIFFKHRLNPLTFCALWFSQSKAYKVTEQPISSVPLCYALLRLFAICQFANYRNLPFYPFMHHTWLFCQNWDFSVFQVSYPPTFIRWRRKERRRLKNHFQYKILCNLYFQCSTLRRFMTQNIATF